MHFNLTKQPLWLTAATYATLMGLLIFRLTATEGMSQPDSMTFSPFGLLMGEMTMPDWLYVSLSLLFILINSIMMLQTVSKFGLAHVYAPLPMVIYLVIGFFIVPQADMLRSALVSFMMLCAINLFIPVFHRRLSMQRVFACNFMLGLTALLSPAVLPFALVFCIMSARFHYSINVAAVSLLGVVTPLLLAAWTWWVAGEPFSWVGNRVGEALFGGSKYDITVALMQDYFLHGIIALFYLAGMVTFLFIKKNISFTLLITAKYAQDGLALLFLAAAAEILLGWADGAIFPILAVVTTPLIYQLLSKKHGKPTAAAYLIVILSAAATCLV